jgi:hypothetical protein
MMESMRKKATLNWGLCPQTPGIYRFPARIAVFDSNYNRGT